MFQPQFTMLATLLQYGAIGYSVLQLVLHVPAWIAAVKLYGVFPVRQVRRMLSMGLGSVRMIQLFVPTIAACFVAIGHQVVGSRSPPLLIATLMVFQVYLWFYQLTPPAVLMLAGSTPSALALRHRIERGIYPYRVVVLFDPHAASALTPFEKNSLEWDNLRTSEKEWQSVVYPLIDDTPLIVIDSRTLTPAVLQECERIVETPFAKKTLFVANPDGRLPGQRWLPAAAVALRLALPDEVVPTLKAMGLRGTCSPDDHFPLATRQ